MADDLQELPEVPQDGDIQGEGGESGEPEPQTPKRDLTSDPDFKAFQSKKDRETAAERQARLAAEQEAQLLRQQLASLQEITQSAFEPDQREALNREIRLKALENENALYRQQSAQTQWLNSWQGHAAEQGIDTTSAEWQKAVSDSLAYGSNEPLIGLIAEEKALRRVREELAKAKPAPEAEEETVADKKQTPSKTGYVIPPSGGAKRQSVDDKVAALKQQRQQAMDEARRKGSLRTEFPAIRSEFAIKARELGVDPSRIEPDS